MHPDTLWQRDPSPGYGNAEKRADPQAAIFWKNRQTADLSKRNRQTLRARLFCSRKRGATRRMMRRELWSAVIDGLSNRQIHVNATGFPVDLLRSLLHRSASKVRLNATGSPGGSLRSSLHRSAFEATSNAPARPVDMLRSLLHRTASRYVERHRLARWIVTSSLHRSASKVRRMPPV